MDRFTKDEKWLRLKTALDSIGMKPRERRPLSDAVALCFVGDVLPHMMPQFSLTTNDPNGKYLPRNLVLSDDFEAFHDILQALMPEWFVVADNALNEWYLPKFRDALNAANVPFGFTALSERFMVWKTRGGYALLELFADAPIRLQWRVAVNFGDVEPQKRAWVGMIAMAYRWGCIELQKDRPDLFDSPIDKEDKTNG